MDVIVSLILPFIGLAILSLMIDKATRALEGIMHSIPNLPDKFEWWFAYLIVLGSSYLVVQEGNFDFFSYININFRYDWERYLFTALIISGGSSFVKSSFGMIELIPSAVRGVGSTVRNVFKSNVVPENTEYRYTQPPYQQVIPQQPIYTQDYDPRFDNPNYYNKI